MTYTEWKPLLKCNFCALFYKIIKNDGTLLNSIVPYLNINLILQGDPRSLVYSLLFIFNETPYLCVYFLKLFNKLNLGNYTILGLL